MATMILSAAGSAIGGSVGGPAGSMIGARLGQTIGSSIEGGGKTTRHHSEGARLEDLAVQTSTYGRMIPQIFGMVRIAGNVIWSRPIKEVATTTTVSSGGGKGGGGGGSRSRQTSTQTTYSYFVTLAIAIGEGPITRMDRVWADSKLLDLSAGTYRIYLGSETQLPDPAMEAIYGVGNTPAYRGLAYVVIEDFPLAAFGNRIPNFTFEVTKRVAQTDVVSQSVEQMVTGLTLIPGSGEFVYDTLPTYKLGGQQVGTSWVQQGAQVPLNIHTPTGKANVEIALNQMAETFPNLEWVSVVVNWFGTTMDIGTCEIFPCVEYPDDVTTTPTAWNIAGYTRSSARVMTYESGAPRYGGTPDDESIVRLLTMLRARGYKVMLYPMLLMDVAGKPWRGNLTGAASAVTNFFTRSNGYNRFINHYATLCVGKVDAFIIGTEMKGLTSISSAAGVYPAVSQLITLAGAVRTTLGSGVKLTYAADWSEYHSADGWYHLDPLWASSAIDMVGIDAYFPLTDEAQTGYDRAKIEQGWTSGEGYDWYYTDSARTTKATLQPKYAWKNVAWWWNNAHVNPNGSTTSWVPQSKKIWFTEYGFPSVDGCANQPNVFVDASASDSAYPRFSRGRVDFMAQREAIAATETVWASSAMVEEKFLWTWDARPYPYWPDLLSVWRDGRNWVTGHWVQGKFGGSHVAAVAEALFAKVGLDAAKIDTSRVQVSLDGFVVQQRMTARAALQQLTQAYQFEFKESCGEVILQPRAQEPVATISATECLPLADGEAYRFIRDEVTVLPQRVEVQYLQRLQRYATAIQTATRANEGTEETQAVTLSLVLSDAHAKAIADHILATRWRARGSVEFSLPMKYAALEVGDVITLTDGAISYRIRLTKIQLGKPGMLKIRGVEDEAVRYEVAPDARDADTGLTFIPLPNTVLEVIETPSFPADETGNITLRIAAAAAGQGWNGASIVRSNALLGEPQVLAAVDQSARMGSALNALSATQAHVFDKISTLDVLMLGDDGLSSATESDVLNGANLAVLGNEVIQFASVEVLGNGKFRLSNMLRGRLGTEYAMSGHVAGERFVMLDERVRTLPLAASQKGVTYALKPVTFGQSESDVAAMDYTITGRSLMPLSPVLVSATRDASGNATLHWTRRARHGGEWRAEVDVPLMETSEQYDVEIINGGNIVRSWRVNIPTQLYMAAEQTADFGTIPASFTVRIYQLSSLVGRGQVAETVI
ncbi:MAG: baseplate megatron protein TIM-barrel domain-containing protein [Rickettsiales bacterium]